MKNLDWEKEFNEKFYSKIAFQEKYNNLNPNRLLIEVKNFIKQTLTQQRTELLEEIKEKVEDRIKHVNIFSTETGNKFKDDVIENINLLNKKDE